MTLEEKLKLENPKCDLGCGLNFYEREDETWIRADGSRAEGIDVVCNFENIELPTDSISEVHMSDVVEHFPVFKLDKIMGEINRIMRNGAIIYGTTPNLDFVLRAAYEKSRDYEFLRRNLYGDQSTWFDQHYNLYTKKTLIELFEKYGFSQVKIKDAWGAFDDDSKLQWLSFDAVKIKDI